MQLPITVIGWFFTLISMVVLTGGAIVMYSLRRASAAEREAAKRNALKDYLMFVVWIGGLAGGAGVLMHKTWALHVLEFFCYALVIMMCMSFYSRYQDVKRRAKDEHVNWLAALAGLVLVSVPVIFIAYLTIATLRSEAVRTSFLP